MATPTNPRVFDWDGVLTSTTVGANSKDAGLTTEKLRETLKRFSPTITGKTADYVILDESVEPEGRKRWYSDFTLTPFSKRTFNGESWDEAPEPTPDAYGEW